MNNNAEERLYVECSTLVKWKAHVEIECREVFLVGRRGQVVVDAYKCHKECVQYYIQSYIF